MADKRIQNLPSTKVCTALCSHTPHTFHRTKNGRKGTGTSCTTSKKAHYWLARSIQDSCTSISTTGPQKRYSQNRTLTSTSGLFSKSSTLATSPLAAALTSSSLRSPDSWVSNNFFNSWDNLSVIVKQRTTKITTLITQEQKKSRLHLSCF